MRLTKRERERASRDCGMQHPALPCALRRAALHTLATVAAGAFVSHLETLPLSPTEQQSPSGKWQVAHPAAQPASQHRARLCSLSLSLALRILGHRFGKIGCGIGHGLSQHSQYLIKANAACGTHMIYDRVRLRLATQISLYVLS